MQNRPDWPETFISVASVLAARSNCSRRKYGCVLVDPSSHCILASGYNGTPAGIRNCSDGGCQRCAGDFPPGVGYELCSCLHAENNAFLMAARKGISIEGAIMYVTGRPCIYCLKQAIQLNIKDIYYVNGEQAAIVYGDWIIEDEYSRLCSESGTKVTLIEWQQT